MTITPGYWTRPFGAILFGYFGDRNGRRNALLSSILFVTFPSIAIICLPQYSHIGIVAPIILIICRLCQGISVGGEYSGASVYFFEHSKKEKRGYMGGLMGATAFFGTILGTISGATFTYYLPQEWGWKIPFLLGALGSIVIFFIRKSIYETPVFLNISPEEKKVFPLKNIIISHKRSILSAIILGGQGHLILYIITIYFNMIVLKKYGIEQYSIMLLNTIILIIWFIAILFFGSLCDKFQSQKILMLIYFIALPLIPFLFTILYNNFELKYLYLTEFILSIIGGGIFGVGASLLPSLFPPAERFSGVALGQTIGQALLGGSAPLIVTFLSLNLGEIFSPALFIQLSIIFGLIFVSTHSYS